MTLDELKEQALAGLSAGADEQSFGLSSRVKTAEQKALRDKYPKTAVVGRVASYIPGLMGGTGEERLLVRGAEAAPGVLQKLLSKLPQNMLNQGSEKLARALPGLSEHAGEHVLKTLGKASVRSGIVAGTTGAANATARKALAELPGNTGGDREKDYGEIISDLPEQIGSGVALGPLGHLLQKSAPAVYAHPALLNRNNVKGSEELANELLKEGHFGSLGGTFKPLAQRLKDNIDVVRDRLIPNAIHNEQMGVDAANEAARAIPGFPRSAPKVRGQTPVEDLEQFGRNRVRDSMANTSAEDEALMSSFNKAKYNLRPDPYGFTTLGDVDRNAKLINTEARNTFSSADKGKQMGDLDGALSAKKARLDALKQAHTDMLEQGIDAHGNPGDLETYEQAKETYGKGARLEGNIREYERSDIGASPHFGHSWINSLLNHTVKAPAARTGLGVLLDRSSPETLGKLGGRGMDLRQRRAKEPGAPAPSLSHFLEKNTDVESAPEPEANPYDAYLKAPAKDEGNPYDQYLSK
jgi:hypothetical protein